MVNASETNTLKVDEQKWNTQSVNLVDWEQGEELIKSEKHLVLQLRNFDTQMPLWTV